jgi:hypothetical protein
MDEMIDPEKCSLEEFIEFFHKTNKEQAYRWSVEERARKDQLIKRWYAYINEGKDKFKV